MEPLIRTVCANHAPHPDLYWATKPDEFFIGKYVKLGFEATGGPEKEHMWVEVTGSQGSSLTGVLNNDPVFCPNLYCGIGVKFTKEEIEAVYDKDGFVPKED